MVPTPAPIPVPTSGGAPAPADGAPASLWPIYAVVSVSAVAIGYGLWHAFRAQPALSSSDAFCCFATQDEDWWR